MKELQNDIKKYTPLFLLIVAVLWGISKLYGTVCYSVILFGIPCPACGITRATKLLLTGHFKESFQMHPLLILVILGVLLFVIIKYFLKKSMLFIKYYGIICIIVFIIYYIYRMMHHFPNAEPMVYRQDNLLHNLLQFFRNREY